jgi:hypothetical protein
MIHSIGMCELSVADSVRPRLKKELFFLSLSLSTAIVGVIGPVIVPSPPQIIATFPTTTVTDYTALVGYLVLTYGFGRRPASFISHLLLLWGIVWAASGEWVANHCSTSRLMAQLNLTASSWALESFKDLGWESSGASDQASSRTFSSYTNKVFAWPCGRFRSMRPSASLRSSLA